MKHLTLSSVAALTIAAGAATQSAPNFQFMPQPNFIVATPTAGVAATFESIQLLKLGNEPDGVCTIIMTAGGLDAAFGGDGVSTGVLIGTIDIYSNSWAQTTEAAALNSSGTDKHLALSADGLNAIFERPGTGVFVASRGSVGSAFGAPIGPVAGFPATALSTGEYHPYLGTVGGTMMCFYTDGNDYLMQPIDLLTPTLTGTATIIGGEVQGGTQPGSPSPLTGADGDVEAIFACDIVLPQTGPGTGDADPTYHSDLDPATPGIIRVQRTDWQGWGGVCGGLMMFSHDILGFHSMHGQVAHLLGDQELGRPATADLRMASTNFAGLSGNPLQGIILFGFGLMAPTPVLPQWYGGLALNPISPVTLPGATTAGNHLDGVIDVSFPLAVGVPTGFKIPIQALMIEDNGITRPTIGFSNTAWLDI